MPLPDALVHPLDALPRPTPIPRRPGVYRPDPLLMKLEPTAAERKRVRERFPDPDRLSWAEGAQARFRERVAQGERVALINYTRSLPPEQLVALWRSVDPPEVFIRLQVDEMIYLHTLMGDEILPDLERFEADNRLEPLAGLRLGVVRAAVSLAFGGEPAHREQAMDWVRNHLARATPDLLARYWSGGRYDLLVEGADETMDVVVRLAMEPDDQLGASQARQLLPSLARSPAREALFQAARDAGFETEIDALAHPHRLLPWPTQPAGFRSPKGWPGDVPRPTIDGVPLYDAAM